MLQNRTGFSKADANGPEQWKATGLERQYLHLKVRNLPTSRANAGSYRLSVRQSTSRRNGKRFTTGSSVAQATKDRLGMQDNTHSVVPQELIREEPLSCKRCLHTPGLPVDANLVVVHCSIAL